MTGTGTQKKPSKDRRDMIFFLLTETDLKHQVKEDFPNDNLILRDDYQKSSKGLSAGRIPNRL